MQMTLFSLKNVNIRASVPRVSCFYDVRNDNVIQHLRMLDICNDLEQKLLKCNLKKTLEATNCTCALLDIHFKSSFQKAVIVNFALENVLLLLLKDDTDRRRWIIAMNSIHWRNFIVRFCIISELIWALNKIQHLAWETPSSLLVFTRVVFHFLRCVLQMR